MGKQPLPPRDLFGVKSERSVIEITQDSIRRFPVITAALKRAEDAEAAAKPKGGRPAKYPDKPWEAAGVSRNTWYRRQKAKEAK